METASKGPKSEPTTFNSKALPMKVLEEPDDEYVDIDPNEDKNNEDSKYFDNELEEDSEDEPLDQLTTKARKRVCNSHDVYFKPMVFLEYFVCHLLFFFLLGPFIVLLKPFYNYTMLWNQGFIGFSQVFYFQLPQYILIILLFVLYYLVPVVELRFIEILTLVVAIVIRCLVISCKYAYSSEALLKLMKIKKLSTADFNAELMAMNWRVQNTIAITEELHAGILRNEIESSLFFFDFLGKDKTNLLVDKFKKQNLDQITKSIILPNSIPELGEQTSTPNSEDPKPKRATIKQNADKTLAMPSFQGRKDDSTPTPPVGLLDINPILRVLAHANAKVHFNLENINSRMPHFFKKKKLEACKLYGYNLAFDMLLKSREGRFGPGYPALAISFVKAWIPTFYRIYNGEEAFTAQPYLVVLTIIINTYFFWANVFIVAISLSDVQTKVFCLKQLAYLISPKKITSYKAKKFYPTMNIFDAVTIKTWSNIRKLLLDFGLKFTQRNYFNVSVILVVYTFVLAFLLVQVLDLVKSKSDPVMLIVFTYETVVFFIIFIVLVLGNAFLNDQFRVHKNILKNNKTIIADFKRLAYHYVGKTSIKPDNYIYKQGVKSLTANITDTKNAEKIVAKRADTLVDALEDVIQELDFEETNNPLKVLGIPASYAIVKSIFALLGSLGFAIAQVKMS